MPAATPDLNRLRRPSGAFAMLAVDQREALRNMMSEARGGAPVDDETVIGFKLDAARLLTPYASAVLVDRYFALERAVAEKVVDPSCALIASADHFIPAHGEVVGEVEIDRLITPAHAAELGASAQKLLVIYRPDTSASQRIEMVSEFVEGCRSAGLVSIIEPLSKKPLDDDAAWDWDAGILAAAEELGGLGADLYKAEVPLHGKGDEDILKARCAELTKAIASPWVILSSGVAEADFPRAISVACSAGASGFLAGRAVWASCLNAPDVHAALATDAAARLQRFCEAADAAVAGR